MIQEKEFFELVDQAKVQMYKIAYAYLGDEARAIDTIDEAVYNAYTKRRQLRQKEYAKTWLIRILLNECNKEVRRRKRELPTDCLPETTGESTLDSLPLKDAVLTLPTDLRKIIVLRYIVDRTVVETAKILDMPQGTIATKTRQALKLLRLELEEV